MNTMEYNEFIQLKHQIRGEFLLIEENGIFKEYRFGFNNMIISEGNDIKNMNEVGKIKLKDLYKSNELEEYWNRIQEEGPKKEYKLRAYTGIKFEDVHIIERSELKAKRQFHRLWDGEIKGVY